MAFEDRGHDAVVKKVMGGLSLTWFMLSTWSLLFRLPPGLQLSGRQYLPSLCLLYVISSLKGEGVANLSVSSAARSPLYQFRLPISHFSLPSALLQKWSGLDSACLAVEALHVEGPLGLQLKNLTHIAVAAIAFLKPILSKPANLWTLAARTLQLLRRPLVGHFYLQQLDGQTHINAHVSVLFLEEAPTDSEELRGKRKHQDESSEFVKAMRGVVEEQAPNLPQPQEASTSKGVDVNLGPHPVAEEIGKFGWYPVVEEEPEE